MELAAESGTLIVNGATDRAAPHLPGVPTVTRHLAAAGCAALTVLAVFTGGVAAAGPASADSDRRGERIERVHHHGHRHHGRHGVTHNPRGPVIILKPVCHPITRRCAL